MVARHLLSFDAVLRRFRRRGRYAAIATAPICRDNPPVWFVRAAQHSDPLEFALRGVKFMNDFIANLAYILLLISGPALVASMA